jgi:hypothetical protein
MYDKCFENKSKNILENRKSVNPFCVSGLEGVYIYIYISSERCQILEWRGWNVISSW